MRLKIISDGTPQGTSVVDADNGRKLEGVDFISVNITPESLTACVAFIRAEFELVAKFEKEPAGSVSGSI